MRFLTILDEWLHDRKLIHGIFSQTIFATVWHILTDGRLEIL